MVGKLMMTKRKQEKRIRLREKEGIFVSFLICILQSEIRACSRQVKSETSDLLNAMRSALCAMLYAVFCLAGPTFLWMTPESSSN
jgi:hypothetical protein